jgi:hypothetical protein
VTRLHRGFTHVRPSGLLLVCNPRMERESLDLSLMLHTPRLPATHVRVGDRPCALAWNYTFDIIEPPSMRSLTTCDRVSHRRLRPTPIRSVDGGLSPPTRWLHTDRAEPGRFPCSLLFA